MIEGLTRDRRAVGLSLTGVTALCPCARHINPCLVLVQCRKTSPNITEKLLTGMLRIKSNKKNIAVIKISHFNINTIEIKSS